MLGKAILLYTNENRGVYPPDLATLAVAEDLTHHDLICPASNISPTTQPISTANLQPGQISYTYLGAGKTVNSALPDEIIVWDATCQSAGGINVLFGDGHSDTLEGSDAKSIRDQIGNFTRPLRLPQP